MEGVFTTSGELAGVGVGANCEGREPVCGAVGAAHKATRAATGRSQAPSRIPVQVLRGASPIFLSTSTSLT